MSGLDIHLNSPTPKPLTSSTRTLQSGLGSFRQRDALLLRYSGQYAEHDATGHLVASIEKGLCVAAPTAARRSQLLKISERLDDTLAAEPIQRLEEQQVKLPLRGRQHHRIKLRTRVPSRAAHSVFVLSDDLPALLANSRSWSS